MPHTRTEALHLRHGETLAARLMATVTAALARRRDRALLARLDAHLLRDIGIDPDTAAEECAKPLWQA